MLVVISLRFHPMHQKLFDWAPLLSPRTLTLNTIIRILFIFSIVIFLLVYNSLFDFDFRKIDFLGEGRKVGICFSASWAGPIRGGIQTNEVE